MDFAITEGSTPEYDVTIVDSSAVPVAAAALSAARLTFYNVRSGAIINDRWNQDIKNAHNVTISEQGAVSWKLQEADTVLVGMPTPSQGHYRAELVFEWNDGGAVPRQFTDTLDFYISRVPFAPFTATP